MEKSLKHKLREVEEEHAIEAEVELVDTHRQSRRDEAMRFLGGALAIDRLKEHLASQVITAYMIIEEEKLYLDYDCERFEDFFKKSEFSQMSKSQYYKLRELYLKEGPEQYNLFTDWKVPLSTRKLLAAGDITVDGDEIVIGGEERVNISESKTIKAVIEKLVKEKISLSEDLEKREAKLEAQSEQIKKGSEEIAEKQRYIDSLLDDSPHDKAVGKLLAAVLKLIEEAEKLPDDLKQSKAEGVCQAFNAQLFRLRDAYGAKFNFRDDELPSIKELGEMTRDEKMRDIAKRASAQIESEGGFEELD